MLEEYGYRGKNVVVTGAFSGIGGALGQYLSQMGANVYALDIKEPAYQVKKFIQLNMGDKNAIDQAVNQLPDSIGSVFNCAGVAGSTYGGKKFTDLEVMKINFFGPRHLINSVVPRMAENSAIAIIASNGATGWFYHIDIMTPLARTRSFEEAVAWFEANGTELLSHFPSEYADPAYYLSKEIIVLWVRRAAYGLTSRKIRLNSVSPGNTATPMSKDFNAIAKTDLSKIFVSNIGRPSTPEEQAQVLLWVNSDLASYVSGTDICAEYAASNRMMFPDN
ncbi:MAG: SDR family oxidoreductase [Planctomycetes bacterium]|nr:SDR family oxidoreductase [Planctomycetota bacterium]